MYQSGDLKRVDPPCGDGYEEFVEEGHRYCLCDGRGDGHVHSVLDTRPIGNSRNSHRSFPPCVYLPHSCDEWVIGGREEVEALIEDLKAALDMM